MQSTMRYALSIILLSSVVSSTYHSSTKLRRDGVLNLYPFPRVGRAGSRSWQIDDVPLNPGPDKRQLYAFPRVGRRDQPRPQYQLSPLEESLSSSSLQELLFGRRGPFTKRQSIEPGADQVDRQDPMGMWFGARLGRSLPIEDDDISQSETEKREPEQLENTNMEREKRQTKHG